MNITLAVMVKNEAKTLPRLLKSVEGIVDNIVALDTGSTDDTAGILEAAGATIYHESFVNFAVSRTRLCELVEKFSDNAYILLADADFVFKNEGFQKSDLKGAPCYALELRTGKLRYSLPRFLKADRDWTFKGVVHEYIEGTADAPKLNGLTIDHLHDGCRSQGNKILGDLNLLVEEHLKHPTEPRTVFYLAQTMRDLGMNGCAQLYYEQRAAMTNTFEEERWYAQREAARLSGDEKKMFDAWIARSWRAEPLMDIVRSQKLKGMDPIGTETLRQQIDYPPKDDYLFIEKDAYDLTGL